MVAAMKAASTSDQALSGQIDELSNLWDRVNQLSELRENRLHGASKLVSIHMGLILDLLFYNLT